MLASLHLPRLALASPLIIAFAAIHPANAQTKTHKHHHRHAARHAHHKRAVHARRHAIRRAVAAQAPIVPVYAPAAPAPVGWLVTVNAKAFVLPNYTGASTYSFIGYPTLSIRRPGQPVPWYSPDDSIEYGAISTPRFTIGPVIAYRGGRYAADEGLPLYGIHKTPWTVEPGVFADVWLLPDMLRVRAELRHGVRGDDGFVGSLGADWVNRWNRFTVAVGPRLKLGDDRFMLNQFGITAADTIANPNFSIYSPKGGLYAVGAFGSLSYKQSDTWSYTLDGGYDRLTGDAGNSPIITVNGSKNQWSIGAIASYTFGWDGIGMLR